MPRVDIRMRTVGDTEKPITARLMRQDNTPENLTNKTVVFRAVNAETGTAKIDDRPAIITSQTNAEVEYRPTVTDVDTAGEFWIWFITRDAGSPSKLNHFPPGHLAKLVIETQVLP